MCSLYRSPPPTSFPIGMLLIFKPKAFRTIVLGKPEAQVWGLFTRFLASFNNLISSGFSSWVCYQYPGYRGYQYILECDHHEETTNTGESGVLMPRLPRFNPFAVSNSSGLKAPSKNSSSMRPS